MTSLKTITLLTLLAALSVACGPDKSEFILAKPESVATLESVNKYAALKTYLNAGTSPNFKLGTSVAMADYMANATLVPSLKFGLV
ncbi:MAG: hypothetical protein EOO39_34365, partial [Cytophagaceae bacterium]